MSESGRTHGKERETHTEFWSENLNGRDYV